MFTRRSFLNLIPAAIAGAALAKKCFGNIVTGEGQAVSTPQLPVPDGSLSFEALRKLAEHPYVRECIAETKYMITWNWHATYGTGSRRGTSEDVFWPGILEHTLEDMLVGDNASLVNCSKLGPRWMIAIAGDRVTRRFSYPAFAIWKSSSTSLSGAWPSRRASTVRSISCNALASIQNSFCIPRTAVSALL